MMSERATIEKAHSQQHSEQRSVAPETPEEKEELDRLEQNDNVNTNANAPAEDVEP